MKWLVIIKGLRFRVLRLLLRSLLVRIRYFIIINVEIGLYYPNIL